jgi:hypothetical protein
VQSHDAELYQVDAVLVGRICIIHQQHLQLTRIVSGVTEDMQHYSNVGINFLQQTTSQQQRAAALKGKEEHSCRNSQTCGTTAEAWVATCWLLLADKWQNFNAMQATPKMEECVVWTASLVHPRRVTSTHCYVLPF